MTGTDALTAAVMALSCVSLAPAAEAAGTANRVWVSGHGVDQPGCGAPTSPCRSLQYAHDNAVAAGGEIDILDPAGYGAITITKALSIVNDGVGTAGVQTASGNAIIINAGATDKVYLRGLNIDGVQQHGFVGVQFNSGGALTVVNCVIRNFFRAGLQMLPTSGEAKVVVLETTMADNYYGFEYAPVSGGAAAKIVLDHLAATNNDNAGVFVDGSAESGAVNVTLVNSDISNDGVLADLGPGVDITGNAGNVVVNVNSTVVTSNEGEGLANNGGAVIHLSRSVLDQNGEFGLYNAGTGGAAVFSTGDNRIEGNGAPVSGTLQSDPLQ